MGFATTRPGAPTHSHLDVLSEKTPEDLSKPGVKAELKAELFEKVREAYEGKKVIRVVFTSFVKQ